MTLMDLESAVVATVPTAMIKIQTQTRGRQIFVATTGIKTAAVLTRFAQWVVTSTPIEMVLAKGKDASASTVMTETLQSIPVHVISPTMESIRIATAQI